MAHCRTKRNGGAVRLVASLLLCALVAAMTACGTGNDIVTVPAFPPLGEPEGLRVAVASDLHFNPDTAGGSAELGAVAYNPQLADALLWDARQQGAGILLLTGDIVNGGRAYRHEALTEKLRQAEADGMDIYVLPGNHDLDPIGQREFAALYADFGYAEAHSRDEASLSYCVIRGDLMLLMLDTGGYGAACIDLPGASRRSDDEAFISEQTLAWAEEMLEQAQKQGLRVLCAGHYNLLSDAGSTPERSGYCVENGDRFADLLRRYGVRLYLSGHIHLRAVYEKDGLRELVTEYLLAYPTGCSMLDLTEDYLRCTPRRVDVDGWAAATGQTDPVLLGFAQWQQQALYDYSVENVRYMSRRNPLTRREAGQAAAFFYEIMDAYWQGTVHHRRAELEAMPGYEPFFRCAEGYAYGWWLKDLIAGATEDLGGFTIPW